MEGNGVILDLRVEKEGDMKFVYSIKDEEVIYMYDRVKGRE